MITYKNNFKAYIIFFAMGALGFSSVVMAEKYRARWEFVGTNKATPWVPTNTAICGAGAKCMCGSHNLCGQYKNGETTQWWPNGCYAPTQTIRCKIVKTH